MSCSVWKEVPLQEVIQFNPTELIRKGTLAKKIGMDKLNTFQRNIEGYEIAEYKSGTKFRNGDTLLARITPCLENGKTAQVSVLEDNEVGFGSTEFIVMREKEGLSVNDYIYYLSISPQIRDMAIKSMTGTSGRQRAQIDVIKNTKIEIPDVNEQKAIANILSSLDDKIEVNNTINKKLEEIAQAIFKQWFVDFEFPNEEGKPYKSSGGAMVESELGMIPEGWGITKIKDVIEVTDYVANGSFSSLKNNVQTSEVEDYAILIRLVDFSRGFKGPFSYVNEKGYNFLKKSKLYGGEIIISNVGANAGTIFKAPKLNKPMTLGPNSIVLLNNALTTYMYYLLTSQWGKGKVQSIIGGSAQPKFNKTDFRNINIILPNKRVINNYNLVMHSVEERIGKLFTENQMLESMRDTLLQKLMSGEIRVSMENL